MLHKLLAEELAVDQNMAARAMDNSQSDLISSESQLGIALIMLGGGRRTESMRTHGVSKTTEYEILHKVVRAINACPALEFNAGLDLETIGRRAAEFKEKSTHKLFEYCVGAIDSLAIRIKVPRRSETRQAFERKLCSTICSKKETLLVDGGAVKV